MHIVATFQASNGVVLNPAEEEELKQLISEARETFKGMKVYRRPRQLALRYDANEKDWWKATELAHYLESSPWGKAHRLSITVGGESLVAFLMARYRALNFQYRKLKIEQSARPSPRDAASA